MDSPFIKKEEYSNPKYSIYSFEKDQNSFQRVASSSESVCILPFDVNAAGKIKNVYLYRYLDAITNQEENRAISATFNTENFSSGYEVLISKIEELFNLKDINIDDLFYLGKVKHSVPFHKEYSCYAINLSNNANDSTGFSLDSKYSSKFNESIEKVKFNDLLYGKVSDSLALSCALLFLSYIAYD
jgi:hypothetical protein